MKHLITLGLFAALFVCPAASLRAAITFSQSPDPFKAVEGTSGNIGFITLKNTDPDNLVYLTSIVYLYVNPTGGESDDEATNVALIAPNPSWPENPVKIAPNGTANIKFSWDAVDKIKDNDIDFGDWAATFGVKYRVQSVAGEQFLSVTANLRVNDTPEPSPASLLGIGMALLIPGLWRVHRKRRQS